MTQPANINPANIHDAKRPEPSMEDILASIRRIVADDNGSRDLAMADTQASATMPVSSSATEKPSFAASHRAADLSAPIDPLDPLAPLPPLAPMKRAPDEAAAASRRAEMDTLLAELEASEMGAASDAGYISDASGAAQEHGDQHDALSEQGSFEGDSQAHLLPDDEIAEQSAELERDILELTEEMAKRINAPEERGLADDIQAHDIQDEALAAQHMASPALGEIDAEALAQPILSQATASAVEAAFNSLASTVLSDNARTLEDLVREMLRPMLKSWLDDNLPGIVERAVRAEIERVARGR